MKLQVRTNVVNGNLKRNRNQILEAIRSYEGKDLLISFEKPKNKRSNPQNAYYWGVLIPITRDAIKNEWGEAWTSEMCHEFYKTRFLFHERVNESTGEVIRIPKSTTENTTTAQEEYHSEIRGFLREWFNTETPLPNEEIQLFAD